MKHGLISLACVALAGCADDGARGGGGGFVIGDDAGGEGDAGTDAAAEAIEVAGTWQSNFDTEEVISAEVWAYMELVSFDNDANRAITQNAEDDEYNPSKFNRIVWTELSGDSFYYCLIAFGKDTAEDAASDPAEADDSDPDTGGCGGFPWTKLTRK